MDAATDNRFSLDEAAAQPPAEPASHAGAPPAETAQSAGVLDLDGIARAHAASATAAYCWNIADDSISWSSNAGAVLQCDIAALATGRKFADFLDSDNIASRYDTVMGAGRPETARDGVPFEIEYCFRPKGRHAYPGLWVEDAGRWYGTADAGPALVCGTMRVADKRRSRDQEMNFLSNSDELTGMMNRARMLKALDEAITGARAEKGACAFAILAVNNLHVINETYGYEVADEVIAAIAGRLRRVMRIGDAVARYSRAKFGIILNGCGPGELAAALERFMRAIRDSVIETPLGPIWALLSIGAVNLPASSDTARSAAACAEEALSEALHLPGDGYVVYSSSDMRTAQRLLNARCATEIVSCLREGRFKLAFQPVRDAATGEHPFHEALLRMTDTTGALVTAAHLVPVAENLGLIRLIDRAVVQMALSTLALHPAARLSLNLSATTVRDPRWNSQIIDALTGAPDLTSRLIVEVPEAAAMDDSPTCRAFLDELHKAGCQIAIDDFGAGLTSYRNLKQLPVSMIKLDGSLCRGLDGADGNSVYVRGMVELARAMGIAVVGEWVESEKDAAALAALGVSLMQGNFIGEPSIEIPWARAEAEALDLESEPQSAPDPISESAPESAPASGPAEQDGSLEDHLLHLQQLLQSFESAAAPAAAGPDEADDLAIAS